MTARRLRRSSHEASNSATGSFTLRRRSARQIKLLTEARHFFQKKRIHPRRLIPPVRTGPLRHDEAPSASLTLAAPRSLAIALGHAAPHADSDDLEIVRLTPLGAVADNNTASNVCEPSVAANGRTVFYTGNWFAALSTDTGATFRYIDPYTAFPDPSGMKFCCDQIVLYIRKIDMFVWLLQYDENNAGENIQRIAFARTSDVATGQWHFHDIRPADVGLPGTFLDFPDLAVGSGMLYVTFNAFTGQPWTASVIVRIPLASLRTANVTAQYYTSRTNFAFRVAQPCRKTAYFAAHEDNSTLRVWSWPESAATPRVTDLAVASWVEDAPYASAGPDGRNWLGRSDGRLTGAAQTSHEVWFSWGANQGGANNRPHPYVQITRLRLPQLTLIENVNVWNPDSATCYGALASNARNEIAMSYAIGGGIRHPSHAVALLTGTSRHVVVAGGTRGPTDHKWGDYLTVRRSSPKTRLFDATGYTLQPASGGVLDATPHFVRFGRSGDV